MVDQEIQKQAAAGDKGASSAECFAACMQHDDVVASFQVGGEAATLGAVDSGCMSFIDEKKSMVMVGQPG
jgi:hypothetical protein